MKCPKCKKEIALQRKDNSFDFSKNPKKKYDRNIYWCEEDDVWITTEIGLTS